MCVAPTDATCVWCACVCVCGVCVCPGHIGSLQATQMTQEAAIRDLESERSRLKDKVLRLEEERGALQTKNQVLDERQRQQTLSLEKVSSA